MKKTARLLLSLLGLGLTAAAFAQSAPDPDAIVHKKPPLNAPHEVIVAAIKDCFDDSGAGTVACMKSLYDDSTLEIRRLEDQIVARARQRRQRNDIFDSQAAQAVSSLRDAARRFKKFSVRQCDFETGYSGAVASGFGEVRFGCLLQLNEERKAYLRGILNETPHEWWRK
jgi:hypothetical protein